jgi:ribonuclease H / adenosylcobalamin/alpha-ribazole phosphatase
MTATLLLIRHAMHTDYGERFTGRADGVRLSAAGEEQARTLGERLADEPIAAVYSSPRERTRSTASAVAAPRKTDVIIDDALDEIDLGDWTGTRIADLEGDSHFQRWNAERGSARPPGGEAFSCVADRVQDFARRASARHADETVAVVSHADVIKALVAACLGLPFDNVLRFEIGPASVSRLLFGDWGAKLLTLNEGAAA